VCTLECEVQVVSGDTVHDLNVCRLDSVEFNHKTGLWTNELTVMIESSE